MVDDLRASDVRRGPDPVASLTASRKDPAKDGCRDREARVTVDVVEARWPAPSAPWAFWRCAAAAANFFGCRVGYSRYVLADVSLSESPERLLVTGTDDEKAMDPRREVMTRIIESLCVWGLDGEERPALNEVRRWGGVNSTEAMIT